MDLDLGALRAFVSVVDHGHFGDAAAELELSQQAVSKRIARLEADLGVPLVRRTSRGAEPSDEGTAVLSSARTLLGLADEVVATARRSRRPLRVDVIGTRLPSADLLHAFHRQQPDVDLEVLLFKGAPSTVAVVAEGTVDAAFARVAGTLDAALAATPAYLEPLHLLVGQRHPLAARTEIGPDDLASVTVWMPGNTPRAEWTAFYEELSADTGLRVDTTGPNWGTDHLLDALADADDWAFFGGERTRLPWRSNLVRVPIRPAPVYPHSLVWRRDARHPSVPRLVEYVREQYRPPDPDSVVLPNADRALLGLMSSKAPLRR